MAEGLELVPVIVAGVYYMYKVDAQWKKKDAGASANHTYVFILSLYCFGLKRRLLDAALSIAKAIATKSVFHVNVVMGACALSAVISTYARKLSERVKQPCSMAKGKSRKVSC